MAPGAVDRPLSDAEMGITGAAPAGADRPLSDAEMGAAEGPGAGESLLRGFGQGVSFNFADEATGAGEALLDKLRGAREAIGELYLKHRDESRKNYRAAQEANPELYTGAEIGGALATAAVPGLGAAGIAKTVAMAAAAGLGASEADTARDLVRDTAISGLVGGAAHAGAALVAKGAGAVAQRMAPALQETSDLATLKTMGNLGQDAKRMALRGTDLGQVAKQGRDLGLVTPLSTVQDVAERGAAQLKGHQDAMVGAVKGLDAKAAELEAAGMGRGSLLTGNAIADRLEKEQMAKLLANPNRSPQAEQYLAGRIKNYRGLGDAPVSFNEADELVRGAQQNAAGGIGFAVDEAINPGVQQVKKEMAQGMRRQMMESANLVDPVLAAQRDQAGRMASTLHPIVDTATGRAAMLGTQSKFGIMGTAGLGAAGMALLHGNVPAAAGLGVAALGQKVIRQYGNSLTATSFNKLAQLARTAPQTLGKWGPYLAQAAARGDAALATAHYVLSRNDKDYAASARLALEGGHE